MDAYKIGKLMGYLSDLELPVWVKEIVQEIEDDHSPERKKSVTKQQGKRKPGKAPQEEENEDAGDEAPEKESASENEEEEENEEVSPPAPSPANGTYLKLKELYKEGADANTMSDKLGLTMPTVYTMRTRAKKELIDEGWVF